MTSSASSAHVPIEMFPLSFRTRLCCIPRDKPQENTRTTEVEKPGPKNLVTLQDVAADFSQDERWWQNLSQRRLHSSVILVNDRHLVTLGFDISKLYVISWLEQGKKDVEDKLRMRCNNYLWSSSCRLYVANTENDNFRIWVPHFRKNWKCESFKEADHSRDIYQDKRRSLTEKEIVKEHITSGKFSHLDNIKEGIYDHKSNKKLL